MKLIINKEELLHPLIKVVSVVEKKQTLAILANVLIEAKEGYLQLLCTDLEVESRIQVDSNHYQEAQGRCTVDAKKFLEIVKALPNNQMIALEQDDRRIKINCGRSEFSLQTLPAEDFPLAEDKNWDVETRLNQQQLKKLIELCFFTMAHHDVRYYLNGMLFQFLPGQLIVVATDGHRLAKASILDTHITETCEFIVPRKAILEINRLLEYSESEIVIQSNKHHFRLSIGSLCFLCKLIDAKYPDYTPLIPTGLDKIITVNRNLFLEAASRSAILCSDLSPGVLVLVKSDQVTLTVITKDREKVSEELQVQYDGPEFEAGYNVMYLIEAVRSLDTEEAHLKTGAIESGCLISASQGEDYVDDCQYLVMPIRI